MAKTKKPVEKLVSVHGLVKESQFQRMEQLRELWGIPFTEMIRIGLELYFKRLK